ncbi:unnamed protein product, partial [Coregonus sp. 'balchen']
MLDVPALRLTTLEELTEEQLKTFQSYLTIGWIQLENADRQDTVDQMVKRYNPKRAVKNTLMILRRKQLDDLTEKLQRDHGGDLDELLDCPPILERPLKMDCPPILERPLEMDCPPILERPLEMANSVNTEVAVNTQENTQRMDKELGRERGSPLFLEHHHMSSPDEFTPEIHDQDNKGEYRFQCPSAGLVFRMEGEGEVLYRTVPWDRRLLAQSGKRPAGPLFNIDCPLKSITETHIIINITGFSAYGDVTDDDAPISPIQGLVLLFHQLFVPEERSILNVLLLPSNVVIRELQDERKTRNGDKETFIETTPHCNLTPNKPYILSTNITHGYRINPTTAAFVDFQSDENYSNTFQLFLETIIKEVELLLKEKEGDELVWNRLVWLPVSAVSLAAPPANPSTLPGRAFIRNHRMALKTRLGLLQPICLRLQDRGVLIDEEREEVVSKSNKTLQNQALLDMVVRKGARAQEHIYQVLKEVDPYLVEDLEEQTV